MIIKLTSFTAFLLLLCFSSFLSGGLSRPIGLEPGPDAAVVEEDWWGHGNSPKPWPFAHPPMPSGGFKWPHKKWPFVEGPMPAGWKWPHKKWPFVEGPMPAAWKWPHGEGPMPAAWKWPHKKWPFVEGPMPAGGKWPHKNWPHKKWPFAKSPFPCPWWPKVGFENVEIAADEIDAPAADSRLEASPLAA